MSGKEDEDRRAAFAAQVNEAMKAGAAAGADVGDMRHVGDPDNYEPKAPAAEGYPVAPGSISEKYKSQGWEGTGSGDLAVQPTSVPRATGATRTYERPETPEERTQRFLEKSRTLQKNPAMETPDERTERFRRKAIAQERAGMLGSQLRANDSSYIDLDKEAANDRQKSANNGTMQYTKERVDQAARSAQPYVDAAVRVGGGVLGELAANRFEDYYGKTMQDMDEAQTRPPPRQPIQMQREFSSEAEKNAYLERVRKARENAAK